MLSNIDPKYIRWALMAMGALDAIGTALHQLFTTGQPINWHTILMVGGSALMGYVMRGPGHVTTAQAAVQAEAARRDGSAAARLPTRP
jgi:hypothetical protein